MLTVASAVFAAVIGPSAAAGEQGLKSGDGSSEKCKPLAPFMHYIPALDVLNGLQYFNYSPRFFVTSNKGDPIHSTFEIRRGKTVLPLRLLADGKFETPELLRSGNRKGEICKTSHAEHGESQSHKINLYFDFELKSKGPVFLTSDLIAAQSEIDSTVNIATMGKLVENKIYPGWLIVFPESADSDISLQMVEGQSDYADRITAGKFYDADKKLYYGVNIAQLKHDGFSKIRVLGNIKSASISIHPNQKTI